MARAPNFNDCLRPATSVRCARTVHAAIQMNIAMMPPNKDLAARAFEAQNRGRLTRASFLWQNGVMQDWPAGLRWLFEHLPFFGVQTEKASMQKASPIARATMWCAGVTSSAVFPTLGALWAWSSGVPWSKVFFLAALFWAVGTLASNWTSRTGDYSKARRALANP
jgi:hypothetical protein